MPTYIALINWTQQGIENVKDSPDRASDANELFESLGGEMKALYLTMGEYDLVSIAEFPDDETAAQAILTLGKSGNVRTKTLRAFPEDDYREIIESL